VNLETLPRSWLSAIGAEFDKPYFDALTRFLAEERAAHTVFPPEPDVLNALRLTPFDRVRVVILGQDPYHDDGQAHGLSFSVRPGVRPPPSLANIFRELASEFPDFKIPNNGYLAPWAEQGVLLLNTVLTVRAHEPNSHRGKGWETFTDAVIRAVAAKQDAVVFVLWGAPAQKKEALIDTGRHGVVKSVHPSPLSARNGFFGSRPFSRVNTFLTERGTPAIDWRLPSL
jgi:uracil-DNA glycosylase